MPLHSKTLSQLWAPARIVERYRTQGIELLNTATSGAIEVNFPRLAQQALIISAHREKQTGFWKSSEQP